MATSQFYSVRLAHESIRACRALLLASPCPSSRSFLHTQSMAAVVLKLRIPCLSFQGSSGYGLHRPISPPLSLRAFSAIGSSPRSRKATDTQNPREEIRKLDEEIHRLERERRSVGNGKNAGPLRASGKAVFGGRKGNGGDNSAKELRYGKPAPSNRNAKFAAASGSIRNVNARATARYAHEEEEEEEEDDDDDLSEEDDGQLGDDFSSDAEMFMETTDAEEDGDTEALGSASLVSEKPSSATTETPILDPSEAAGPISEAPIADNVSVEGVLAEGVPAEGTPADGVPSTKHPWKEWNDFYDVLAQKNYFKDVPPSKFSLEGEGYLRFQSSAHMKRAILEFSRERDDIIRFLTKKHIRTVVSVGCPSTERKVVNSCKRLRVLCEIPEDETCQQCKLKTFCTRAFAAPSPDLVSETVDVARILYSFALNASPNAESQVSYPIGVVKSVCHLIDEIVQLSAYPKDPALPPLKSRLPVKPPVVEKDEADNSHRPGDWTCPDCNFLNFSKNRECRECGTFRESAKQLEPGDWECPECTFVNFRRNRECRECLTPRPPGIAEAGVGGENMKPGEWKCPECQYVNFRRNSDCRKCSTKRPKGLEPHDDEDYEPGDWKCPECKFRNFQRNKNCRECGALSPVQGRKDDRWGLKKASVASDGGWGSNKSLPATAAGTEGDKGSIRPEHQEWKPDLNKAMSDDSDDDLEENADVIFGRHDDDEDSPRPHKGPKSKGSISRRSPTDEPSLSDFDLSDLDVDDHPKKSKRKCSKDEDDDDVEDDDNDMLDELSGDEETTSRAAPKRGLPAKGKSFSKKWDDSASDDEDVIDDDHIPLKRTPAKRTAISKKWDNSDDDEDEGFSDDDDDFGSSRGRGRGSRGGPRGRVFGGSRGQRGGSFGSLRGSQRGGSFSSSRGGGDSYGRGGRGRRSSNFSESSGDDEESSRVAGGRGARGEFSRGGKRRSSFLESSGDEEEFSRGGGGRGGRGGFTRGGGRGRGGGGFSRGGGRGGFEREGGFSRGGGQGGFERDGGFSRGGGRGDFRGGFEGGRGRGGGGGRGGRGGRRGRSW